MMRGIVAALTIVLLTVRGLDSTILNTPDFYAYHNVPLSLDGITSVVFTVRASNDAHVALSTDINAHVPPAYEIVIGGWRNTKCAIRTQTQGSSVSEEPCFRLRSGVTKTFYVSWEKFGNIRTIRLGEGSEVGHNIIVGYNHYGPYDVNYMSVTTGFGSTGTWEIPATIPPAPTPPPPPAEPAPPPVLPSDTCDFRGCSPDFNSVHNCQCDPECDTFEDCCLDFDLTCTHPALIGDPTLPAPHPGVIISTSDEYSYTQAAINLTLRTSMVFTVRAGHNAHIALSANTDPLQPPTYEIVIGGWGNTKCVIRTAAQQDPAAAEAPCSDLDPDLHTTFYLSWELEGGSRIIKLGSGSDINHNVIVQYTHNAPYDVNYISVSTGWGGTGIWKIFEQSR